jgi:hypothetical protein
LNPFIESGFYFVLFCFQEELINKQCGYYVRHPSQQGVTSLSEKIYTTGCLEAGEKWLEEHLIPVAGAAVGVALIQVRVNCKDNLLIFKVVNLATSD